MTEPIQFETLTYRLAGNGVVFIAIDVKGRKVNVLTPQLHREIGVVAERLAGDGDAIGAVVHSGKSSFMAGGDLNRIVRYYDLQRSPEEAYQQSRSYTEALRKLETCGKPVAVAVNGAALGGGLELTLACHYRVVVDDPEIRLGLPEVTLGLIPGGGGTQRLPRMIGLKEAASLILSGKSISPAEALELGIVDQVVAADELLSAAEKWVLESGNPQQPWDRKGFRVPGGAGLSDMNIGRLFSLLTARMSAEHRHNYPAPIAALRCLFNGTTVKSMDAALKIETREFSALTRNPVARNIIRTMFINKGQADRAAESSGRAGNGRNRAFSEKCRQAYVDQGLRMAADGIRPALIENAAFAAGMPEGPLGMAEEGFHDRPEKTRTMDVEAVKQALLCIQVLTAAEIWAEGLIEPADADLASILGCGFPSYTGGVMSFIDTMGMGQFFALCDQLTADFGEDFRPSERLRGKAGEGDRIYPPAA